MDGGLYPNVIMMLQAIDLKPETQNPIHDLRDEQIVVRCPTLQVLCF
jgi:hypothetical protein